MELILTELLTKNSIKQVYRKSNFLLLHHKMQQNSLNYSLIKFHESHVDCTIAVEIILKWHIYSKSKDPHVLYSQPNIKYPVVYPHFKNLLVCIFALLSRLHWICNQWTEFLQPCVSRLRLAGGKHTGLMSEFLLNCSPCKHSGECSVP